MEKTPKKNACKKASEVVAICDHPNFNVESLIRTIRGQKVMLDFDLSMLYGVQNKRLNEQVKRNKERFPDDFMFQLTPKEWNTLRSQIATAKQLDNEENSNLKSQIATSSWGGVRKRPYAFTRNGIAMLSSVLRSETAVDVNIRIMRAFTSIPQIVNNNALMMQRILNVEMHQIETDEKVNQILKTIEANSPKLLNEKIFATGCVWDAWAYVSDLVRSAKQRIVLIDK
jgi:ribosomal protein S13